jgi:hypothetical protein
VGAQGVGAQAGRPPPFALVLAECATTARLVGRGSRALAGYGGFFVWNRFARRAPLALAVVDLGREAVKRAVTNALSPAKR